MAWPPFIPPNTRSDSTPQAGNHPGDHNDTSNALTEIVAQVQTLLNIMRRVTAGTATVTIPATQGVGTLAVTFPAGLFTAPPRLVAGAVAGSNVWLGGVGSNTPTVSGGSIIAFRNDGANVAVASSVTVHWIAVQP